MDPRVSNPNMIGFIIHIVRIIKACCCAVDDCWYCCDELSPNGISDLRWSVRQCHPSRSLETLALHYLTNPIPGILRGGEEKKKKFAVFLSAKKRKKKEKKGFWMEWRFSMQSRDATPSRRREMASPNNTELYNGSDRRAIKQSGSQAFQISLPPTL